MKRNTFSCDVCSKMRSSDSNHWWLITIGSHALIVQPWDRSSQEEIENAQFHVCGRDCLAKKESELLDKFTTPRPIEISEASSC